MHIIVPLYTDVRLSHLNKGYLLTYSCYNVFCVTAPSSDQAYEHVLRHRQQQGGRKTAKHVDDGRLDDRIQARTGDVTTSASGPGRPDLVRSLLLTTVLLSCVSVVTCAATWRTTFDVGYFATTLT